MRSKKATIGFAAVTAALGVAILVQTALAGGGLGYLLGALLILAGILRLWLLRVV